MGGGCSTPSYFKDLSLAVVLVNQTAYSGHIVGAGANCSFSELFVGPAYKCPSRAPRVSPVPLPSG
jgi:hypothetical protein